MRRYGEMFEKTSLNISSEKNIRDFENLKKVTFEKEIRKTMYFPHCTN